MVRVKKSEWKNPLRAQTKEVPMYYRVEFLEGVVLFSLIPASTTTNRVCSAFGLRNVKNPLSLFERSASATTQCHRGHIR
ncbi:hypothetical protein QE152_g4129 [Popillia japonica]|uniref:Uncharacterized protein n=1 Tax=Popillia japonica TaxID=7064 RepID=A0AAW1N1U5_POPJA